MSFEEVSEDQPKLTRFQAAEARVGTFVRPSEAVPAPVDREGIPFITNEQLGAILGGSRGRSRHTARHISYSGLPQYKAMHQGIDNPQASHTWFSIGEVTKHVRDSLHDSPHLKDAYIALKGIHESETARVAKERSETGVVHDYFNQPHPTNAALLKSDKWMPFPHGRPFTVDNPSLPNREQMPTGFSSNLENPLRHGHMIPINTVVKTSRNRRRGAK